MSDMNSVLLYPSDVDNFGFDWGNLALTVGPTVNGAQAFSAGVVFVPPGQGHTHEVPFLMTNHPGAYDGIDADESFAEGMVISVETTMLHPTRGFIKLEDTLAVTSKGN